jgi:2-keto-4-pentenoate hydratase
MTGNATPRPDLLKAAALLRAARSGSRLPELPADAMPADAGDAYRIQLLVIGDGRIGGWKMGARPSAAGRLCCALSADWLLEDGALLPAGAFHKPEIEVEIAFRLRTDLPPRAQPYSPADMLAALGAAHVVFEVVDSRFVDRKAVTKLSLLADAYSCGAVCVGASTEEWRQLDCAALAVSLEADGTEIATAPAALSQADMLEALTWLANHASEKGTGLVAGQVLLTGARIGPLPVGEAQRLHARIEGIGAVRLRIRDG